MRIQREKGIALVTSLLLMLIISAIIVGLSWMVMTDQRLDGNNQTRESAFYGAEAGMEKLTADVGNTFITNGTIASSDVTTIVGAPPSITGIQFKDSANTSTYQILCGTTACTGGNPPTWNNSNILPPSPYAGMSALISTLGLQVAAQTTTTGAEVKLQRQVQLLAIPVFQFGVFSNTDLAFFNGPTMNFQGRVHTNGNLWLNPNPGPVNLWNTVTVSGQVIRTNLENGWAPTAGGTITTDGSTYGGYVNVALSPSPTTGPPTDPYSGNSKWRYLSVTEGSTSGYSVYGDVSTTLNNPTWSGTVEPTYNGMLVTGAPTLNLTTTSLGGIQNPIFLIRRPTVGELASNPGEFAQQYFSEASLRILLDDYATPGNVASGCAGSDMMSLDGIDTATNPLDLTTLDGAKPGWWNANTTQSGSKFVPLPTAALVTPASTAYTVYNTSSAGTGDGYWVTNGSPTITGCIKIEYQDNNNVFHDITKKILGAGFTGRNINPSSSYSFSTPLKTPYLPTATQVGAQGPTFGNINVTSTIPCSDPSTGAIIRLERVRDNPSTATAGNSYCGTGLNDTNGYNYWPLVLYDSREGLFRGSAGAIPPNSPTQSPEGNPELTMKGVMYYVELDAANLATWLSANQAGLNLMNNSGFGVYFSDRRGEQTDPNAGNTRTGSFGFNDVVNPSDTTYGCPNGALDSGEDFEGDGILRTYGAAPTTIPYLLTGVVPAGVGNLPTTATMAVLQNAYCTATYTRLWPGADLVHVQEARENMPFFFRRALKIVNGQSMNAGTSCYGAGANPPCGVTVASENPVYIQGDFNAVYSETTSPWSLPAGVASSVAADAITLLSDNWNDVNTFINPYDDSYRKGVTTAYRVAIIAGKELPFPWPSGQAADLGTDGGVHNLMRFLENWNSSCYYMGSLVTFSFNRQALGLFQSSGALYAPPSRQFSFDTNFTNGPQWLPPDTPVLRSINTTGFSQMMMPTQ